MKEVAISEFKARCNRLLTEVARTGEPIRIVRLGKPVAEVFPPARGKRLKRRLGSMQGTAQILSDIVGPTGKVEDWEAGC